MTWNLHIVGDKVLEEVDAIAAEILKAVQDAGHTVVSAVLTTDLGSQDVTPVPAEPPADATPPADAPADPTVPSAVPAEGTAPAADPATSDPTAPVDPAVPVDTPPVA